MHHLITKLWNWLIALMKPYHRCAGVIHPTCWLTTELMNRHISSSYIYSPTWTTQCTFPIARASPCQFIKSYLHQEQPSAHCMLLAFLGAHCALLSRDHPRRASIREPSVITQQKHLVLTLFFWDAEKYEKTWLCKNAECHTFQGGEGQPSTKCFQNKHPSSTPAGRGHSAAMATVATQLKETVGRFFATRQAGHQHFLIIGTRALLGLFLGLR